MALCFIFIGGKIMITKKPIIYNSKWMFMLIFICYVPIIFYHLKEAYPFDKSTFSDFSSPFILFLFLVYLWFVLKGYSLLGVKSDSFRNALVYALQKSDIKYTETFNKIILTDYNSAINIGMQSWMGTGQLRWKTKDALKEKTELINNIREYYKNNEEKPSLITPIFYLIFGITVLVMGIMMMMKY